MTDTKVTFTAKRVETFTCRAGKQQDFLWDASAKGSGLGLRVKGNGRPVYVFQSRFQGKTVRMTIGRIDAWSISEARSRARLLQALIDSGRDPRVVKAETIAADQAKLSDLRLNRLVARDMWEEYIAERRPLWSDNHYHAHIALAQRGGEPRKRSKKLTKPGPLSALLDTPLLELDKVSIKHWAEKEAKVRSSSARLAVRLLKAFLHWLGEQPEFEGRVDATVASGKRLNEILGKAPARRNALRKEQLSEWFKHVRAIPNRVISAYLQCLLLTGARREELAQLCWKDVDFRWKTLKLCDKCDEAGKEIPLTPCVERLIAALPRTNEWVFSSPTSARGYIVDPKKAHNQACAAAGLQLSIHDLRRSFKSLAEWLEIPMGVTAQIMGHRPSATAEKHYIYRPVDLLRVHHEKLESWILSQAEIATSPAPAAPRLAAVR